MNKQKLDKSKLSRKNKWWGANGHKRKYMQKEKKYEICFILGENHTEDKAKEISKEVVRIIEKRGGKLEREFFWGKRKLAYPIKRNSFGYYFIFVFVADPVMVNKMTKDLGLDEQVLRYLTTDYLENTAFWEENGGEKRERKEGEKREERKEKEWRR